MTLKFYLANENFKREKKRKKRERRKHHGLNATTNMPPQHVSVYSNDMRK